VISPSRKVLCLDWDKRSLRIVAARVGKGRTVLEDAHSHRLPNTVDADDPEAMGDFIRSMLRRHRLHHKSVVVDVPRERAVINRLRLPPTPTAEVAAAVRFQAMKELPFPLDTAAVDYVIMGRDESGLATEVLLAAVTTETLERVRSTCEAAGLTPARIGLRPYANLTSVRQVKGPTEQRVLFLDVGPGATEIDVMHGDAISFARSANVNVPAVTGEPGVREDSRVIALAEISDLASSDEAIELAVNELLVETTRTLQAFRAAEPDAVIDEVVVAGGTGVENQLASRLHQRLGLPVQLFDPTEALGVDAGEAPKLRSFSAALGLAWGVGREGALALDFLNPKRPVSSRETLQRRVRTAALAAILVLVAVAGGLGKKYHGLAAQRSELRAANSRLQAKVEKKVNILNRIEEVQEWAVEAVWPEELLNVTEIAAETSGQPGEKMVVQEVSLDTVSRTPGITLRNVYATDGLVPTEFVERLNRLEDKGEPLYQASQGVWSLVPEGAKFKGRVDMRIQLRKLQEFRDAAAERLKARKDRLKELGAK
jgi:type IV pilus assembly protein PilM